MAVTASMSRRAARWLALVLVALGLLALAARYVVLPLLFWRFSERLERPTYEVVGSLEADGEDGRHWKMELRRYQPYLVAEVRLPRGMSEEQARASGFRQVAGYIFGGNLQRKRLGAPGRVAVEREPEKIAMTVPVQQETNSMVGSPSEAGCSAVGDVRETMAVTFTMPSKYKSLAQLPVPTNRNVTLRAVPAHFVAAVGFRGRPPTPAKVASIRRAMEFSLAAAGVRPRRAHAAWVYQYHDPFATPRLLRWNEVVLPLETQGMEERC